MPSIPLFTQVLPNLSRHPLPNQRTHSLIRHNPPPQPRLPRKQQIGDQPPEDDAAPVVQVRVVGRVEVVRVRRGLADRIHVGQARRVQVQVRGARDARCGDGCEALVVQGVGCGVGGGEGAAG